MNGFYSNNISNKLLDLWMAFNNRPDIEEPLNVNICKKTPKCAVFFVFFHFSHIFSCFYRKHMLFFYFPANFPHELPLCFQSMRSDWLNKQSFLCATISQTQALCGCVFICSSQCISTDTPCVSLQVRIVRETHKEVSVRILPPASSQSSPHPFIIKVSWWKK